MMLDDEAWIKAKTNGHGQTKSEMEGQVDMQPDERIDGQINDDRYTA